MQHYVWSVALLTHTCTQNILFQVHLVIVVTFKALIIFFFAVLDILQPGTLTYTITYLHILPMTCYMVKKLQQMRKIIVEQIPGAIFQGGGLRSTTFVIRYQNVCLGLQFSNQVFATLANLA